MTNKKKQHIKKLMEKTGMSFQAAHNINSKALGHSPGAQPRSVEQLLVELRTKSTFSVEVGQLPFIAQSPVLSVAQAAMQELKEHPVLYARTGSVELTVSFREYDALIAAGAAKIDVQVFRVFQHDAVTFAAQCGCGRWINCGHAAREAACFCGRMYRVVFDLPRADWSKMGDRCTECGNTVRWLSSAAHRMPLRLRNSWQVICAKCFDGPSKSGESVA